MLNVKLEVDVFNQGLNINQVAKIEIENLGTHPKGPDKGNYKAIFFGSDGNSFYECRVLNFIRSQGAVALLGKVMEKYNKFLRTQPKKVE